MKDIDYTNYNKLISEFKNQFPKMDYFTQDVILKLMDKAFTLGYNVATERTSKKVERSDGMIYTSVKAAASLNGVVHQSIRDAINYNRKSGGYYWKYVKS